MLNADMQKFLNQIILFSMHIQEKFNELIDNINRYINQRQAGFGKLWEMIMFKKVTI